MTSPVIYGTAYTLLHSLPDHYWDDQFIEWWCYALGQEVSQLERWVSFPVEGDIQQVLRDGEPLNPWEGLSTYVFVKVATGDALNLWEDFVSLQHDTSLTDVARRARVIARLRGRHRIPTVNYIEQAMADMGVTAKIDDDPAHNPDYTFKVLVLFPTGGLPTALRDQLVSLLDDIKPAHLAYTIQEAETDWVDLDDNDWVDMGDNAWNEDLTT